MTHQFRRFGASSIGRQAPDGVLRNSQGEAWHSQRSALQFGKPLESVGAYGNCWYAKGFKFNCVMDTP